MAFLNREELTEAAAGRISQASEDNTEGLLEEIFV